MDINIEYRTLLNNNALSEMEKKISTEELKQAGEKIALVLNIPKTKNGLYKTTWGDKNAVGLYFTFLNLVINT